MITVTLYSRCKEIIALPGHRCVCSDGLSEPFNGRLIPSIYKKVRAIEISFLAQHLTTNKWRSWKSNFGAITIILEDDVYIPKLLQREIRYLWRSWKYWSLRDHDPRPPDLTPVEEHECKASGIKGHTPSWDPGLTCACPMQPGSWDLQR